MNILILMDMPLFPYRIYAYNELSNRGYDLTVISVSDVYKRQDRLGASQRVYNWK